MSQSWTAALQGTSAKIIETRKTVPGLRVLDKWAVLIGGGSNHRMGLYDMVMIKDNHVTAAGSITAAVERCQVRRRKHAAVKLTDCCSRVVVVDNIRKPVKMAGGSVLYSPDTSL